MTVTAWRRLVKPLLVVLALNVGVFAAWTFPKLLQERNTVARASLLEQELERERARVGELQKKAETLQRNMRDERRFLMKGVGKRREALVPVLQDVIALAEAQGLKPKTQNYSRQPVKGTPLMRFEITIPVQGTYRQLASFLASMERSPHFVTIERVALAQREQSAAGLDIVLSAYFRADPADFETPS